MAGTAQQQGTRKRAKGRGQVAQKKGKNEEKDTLWEGGAEGDWGVSRREFILWWCAADLWQQ